MSAKLATKKRYAMILAGGSGQRFWPLSRDHTPKQLLRLFGEKTLMELTVERLEGLIPLENILVLTNKVQELTVREVLPMLPAHNILAEPEKRDTAAAIALGVGWVAQRDAEATMIILPSDHLIEPVDDFQSVLMTAIKAAEEVDAIVTVGIKPTWSCPSYGYIERGEGLDLKEKSKNAVCRVKSFREKPNQDLAQYFLDQGNFSWNAGMFIWSIQTVKDALAKHCPVFSVFVNQLTACKDLDTFKKTIQDSFAALPKLSIDYALLEKHDQVLHVEAKFKWDDVGNWISIAKYLKYQDEQGNGSNVPILKENSNNNLVFGTTGQKIALLGVEDLLVIPTPDALLIAHRSQSESIKKIVEQLPIELR
jgi:mannose-1-phosphate guanylyltransferase